MKASCACERNEQSDIQGRRLDERSRASAYFLSNVNIYSLVPTDSIRSACWFKLTSKRNIIIVRSFNEINISAQPLILHSDLDQSIVEFRNGIFRKDTKAEVIKSLALLCRATSFAVGNVSNGTRKAPVVAVASKRLRPSCVIVSVLEARPAVELLYLCGPEKLKKN